MVHKLYSEAALAAMLFVCGFAIWKGDRAERAGALLIAATWVVTLVASAITQRYAEATAFLASDGLMAVGLLILAIRYSSLWMGAAMLVQAVVLSFHAAWFTAVQATDQAAVSKSTLQLYILGKNLGSILLLVIILAATVFAIIKRNRKGR
jgi:hypothetical protein